MEYLVIRLAAPMSSWGEPAVGEFRPSAAWPGDSSLIGLLGAAFGIDRLDIDVQHALRDSLRFAVGVLSAGDLLRDYHTAQVPGRSALKGRPHRTRRDELLVTKSDLNTVLSTREYRQNGDWLVAIAATAASRWRLAEVASALQRPKFVLYLGRKSCPPAAPLAPRVIDAENVLHAFREYLAGHDLPAKLNRLVWSDGVEAGVAPDLSTPRKDRLISRKGWQFGDRMEHSALLGE